MAVELKDVLDYLNISDPEKFKEEFNSKYLSVDQAHADERVAKKVMGKRMTELTSSVLPVFKMFDPAITHNKLSEKMLEESFGELVPIIQQKITAYEDMAKAGNDKKVTELTKQLEDKDKSYQAEKEVNQRLTKEYDEFKTSRDNEIKTYKTTHQYGEVKSRVGFIDDMTEIQRIGFDTFMNTNFKFDLDEHDKLRILDKEGKPIQSKAKAALADPFEIMTSAAEANGLLKKNNAPMNRQQIKLPESKKQGVRQLPQEYLDKVK